MSVTADYDVAIVGGGPAGSSAAWSLANQGWQVAVFEAQRYPHDKLCGEFLSPECRGFLASMDLDLIDKSQEVAPIDQVGFTAPNGSRWQTGLPFPALGISRRSLDARLINQVRRLGVSVFEGSQVTRVEGNLAAGFCLNVESENGSRQVKARAVIGAQGKRSRLDASLQRAFMSHPAPFVALKAHFQGLSLPGRIEMYTFPGGYCGMSEVEGGLLNVCLLVSQAVFRQASRGTCSPTDNFYHWMLMQNSWLRERLEPATLAQERWMSIAQVSFAPKPAMDRDVLMVGDAAGLVPPLIGDGIGMALESGHWAGKILNRFLSEDITALSLRQVYPIAWRRRFAFRLNLGRALQPVLLRPEWASLAFGLLTRLPRLGQYLITNTRGKMIPGGQERISERI